MSWPRHPPARTRTAWWLPRAPISGSSAYPAASSSACSSIRRGSMRRLQLRQLVSWLLPSTHAAQRPRYMTQEAVWRGISVKPPPIPPPSASPPERGPCVQCAPSTVNKGLRWLLRDIRGALRRLRCDLQDSLRKRLEMADQPVGAQVLDRRLAIAEVDRHDRNPGGARGGDIDAGIAHH